MLISGMAEDEEGGAGRGEGCYASEYQTADELFELISKNHSYDNNDEQSLSTRDLVILYKNIDVGTKLMSSANNLHRKTPNQHVETIVYKDDKESDDSDVSEIYSNEDLHNICLVNNERIDLMNNMSCIQHNLCHKLGGIEIQTTNFSTEYDRQFFFKDPYIKEQLKNINIMAEHKGVDAVLPASLLDYICCKRLEDNYNFYMENIIRYVQHTIDQLKRISNGDYLTDRAKEKWQEVGRGRESKIAKSDAMKVLATSVSIPLHVEAKVNRHRSTWDDIVHSEVDIRSLSKILEKKIIIEVPKLICGSYRLFSERYADNLIISCKKDSNTDNVQNDEEESRLDVVFQLKRSESGHVISNINSIMILQNIATTEMKAVKYQANDFEEKNHDLQEHVKIIELDESNHEEIKKLDASINNCHDSEKQCIIEKKDSILSNNYYLTSSQSSVVDKGLLNRKVSMKTLKTETDFTIMSPDELRCTIQRLNMQAPVPEECEETSLNKKKSPTKVRIKSPYENKSFFMEEKKRKKLLEIREKREKKKMALSENCKITKHKYGKGAVMAQSSNSVTKLSISNKSFYNSIYGESLNHDIGISKKQRKIQKKENDIPKVESELLMSPDSALAKNPFHDVSPETVINIQQSLNTEECSTSNFTSPSYNTNMSMLSQLTASSETDSSSECGSSSCRKSECNKDKLQESDDNDPNGQWTMVNLVPTNTPKINDKLNKDKNDMKKVPLPVECRKSIDKIYDLMKKLERVEEGEITNSSRQCSKNTDILNTVDIRHSSTIQISDSGTSMKHHGISSNPSSLSFDKKSNSSKSISKDKKNKDSPTVFMPKVIISSKSQTSKVDTDKSKIDRKRNLSSPSHKDPAHPLKAISQLLHEFDNVQQKRHKAHRKIENDNGKTITRQGPLRKSRQEQPQDAGSMPIKSLSIKEKRFRSGQVIETEALSNHTTHADERHVERTRTVRRKLCDIIDEAKEARGEAVRGPSKPYSRINSLAQPKKLYSQAHHEESQIKYGRNIIAQRVQRPGTSTPNTEKYAGISNPRNRRKGPEITSVSPKPAVSTIPVIDKTTKPRRSASNSPIRRPLQSTAESLARQSNTPETPENLKKMVAVASYVKNHYGPVDTSQLVGNDGHKSRVPLIPNDIELESMASSPTAEESTALGNKLHYMIDTVINTNAPCLSILPESEESMSKLTNENLENLSVDNLLKIEEPRSESDYPVDIFGDKNIVTAVASIPKNKIFNNVVNNNDAVDTITYDVQSFNSATELRKLENALYEKISVGAFPKRLRIKNLTLTPKQSLQQVIVVQSGDAGSLLVKSSLSQNLRTSRSKTESLTAIKSLATLSNTHIKWGLTGIPAQVATVGYAFPTFTSIDRVQHIDISKNEPASEDIIKSTTKSHKTSQCFKGVHTEASLEQSTQANFKRTLSKVDRNINTVDEKENIEIESATNHQQITEQYYKDEDIALLPKISTSNSSEQKVSDDVDNIDHSTSLGILMGLLNEIRKLTGETNNINTNDRDNENHGSCQELEIILNKAATQESSVDNDCRDIISVTSFQKLQHLSSKPSICSVKSLRSEKGIDKDNKIAVNNLISINKSLNVDKEVNVSIQKQYVHKLTDAPSCFFTFTTEQHTTIADSVIQIISKPFTQSVYSVTEYDMNCNSSSFEKLVQNPKIETSFPCIHTSENTNDLDYINNKKKFHQEQYAYAKLEGSTVGNICKYTSKTHKYNFDRAVELEFDVKMKFKRDVLVTVYSILVFTVFTALSFGQILYQLDM